MSPYFEKFQDGDSYDLSKLSDEMLSRIGIDYQVNYSSDKKMAELKNIENKLEGEINIDLSTNEVEKLMKLCKVVKQEKDRTFKTAINDALSGIPEMLTGAITGLAVSRTLNVNQTVRIPFDSMESAKETLEAMKNLGYEPDFIPLLDNSAEIRVEQHVFKDTRVLDSLMGAGIGVLTNTLMSMAFGKEIEENSCLSISDYDINDTTYTNVEQYKEYIARTNKNPKKVNAIKILADTYYKQYGDDWHVHYQQALRDMAGIGSKLNPEECRMMKYQTPAVDKTGKPDEMPVKAKQDKRPAESSPVRDCVDNDCNASIIQDINMKDSNKYYWDEIINMYYSDCLKENGGTHTMKEIRFKIREVNNIPHDYKSIPANIILPYDLFGDGSCERTERKEVALRPRGEMAKVKVLTMQLGDCTAIDECDGQTATGKTKEEALANLKQKTGKTYTNEEELLK